MAMTATPFFNRIIAKLEKIEKKTAGGIITPYKDKADEGENAIVLAVGLGKRTNKKGKVIEHTLAVKENDRVLIKKGSGQLVTIDEETILIIKEEDIIGVIED